VLRGRPRRARQIKTNGFRKHSWVLDEGQRQVARATERPHHRHEWQLSADDPVPPWSSYPGGRRDMAIHDQGRTVGAVEPASADGRFTAQLPDGLPGPLAALLIFIAVAADRGRLPLILHHPKDDAGSPTCHEARFLCRCCSSFWRHRPSTAFSTGLYSFIGTASAGITTGDGVGPPSRLAGGRRPRILGRQVTALGRGPRECERDAGILSGTPPERCLAGRKAGQRHGQQPRLRGYFPSLLILGAAVRATMNQAAQRRTNPPNRSMDQ